MTTREQLKQKYKSGNAFVADISKRTILILEEIEAFLENNDEDLFGEDVGVSDYFSIMSLGDKINSLFEENEN